MSLNEKAAPRQQSSVLPTLGGATAAITFSLLAPKFAGEVVDAGFAPTAAQAANATNFMTLVLFNKTSAVTIATLDTTTVPMTANVFSAFNLVATNTSKRFASGDSLELVVNQSGTGNTITTPTFWMEYIEGTYDS